MLDRAAAFRDTAAVLEAHSIPAALSADLQEGLPQWPPVEGGGGGGKEKPVEAAAAAAGA